MRIPTVHVEGNVFQKSKALREFKQDDEVRVILLCSERAAAGTNLMEASHVVLLGNHKVLIGTWFGRSLIRFQIQ